MTSLLSLIVSVVYRRFSHLRAPPVDSDDTWRKSLLVLGVSVDEGRRHYDDRRRHFELRSFPDNCSTWNIFLKGPHMAHLAVHPMLNLLPGNDDPGARCWAIANLPPPGVIEGLTLPEATAVCSALVQLSCPVCWCCSAKFPGAPECVHCGAWQPCPSCKCSSCIEIEKTIKAGSVRQGRVIREDTCDWSRAKAGWPFGQCGSCFVESRLVPGGSLCAKCDEAQEILDAQTGRI
jgi:hypothetical protein